MRGMFTEKNVTLPQLGAEKITFPQKLDGQTDRHTDEQTYRVALLLKRYYCRCSAYVAKIPGS